MTTTITKTIAVPASEGLLVLNNGDYLVENNMKYKLVAKTGGVDPIQADPANPKMTIIYTFISESGGTTDPVQP